MQAPASHHLDLYKYWLGKRGARIMPARGDIDAADIPHLLPYLLIAEKAGDQFRYRLVGSAVVGAIGYEATGTTAGAALVSPGDAAEVRSIFGRVFTGAFPVFSAGEFVFKKGARPNMSMFTLPLSEDGSEVNMSISTLAARFTGLHREKPDRREGLPVKVLDVLDVRDNAQLEKFCLEWEQRSAA